MSLPNDPTLTQPNPDRSRGPRMSLDMGEMHDPLASKREKARERQRKKRERDRSGLGVAGGHDLQMMHDPQAMMTPEESARKEKVRLAARERQRKHRAVVKARRMAELGLAIPTNPSDPLGYRMNEDGEMEPVHDANAAHAGANVPGGYPSTPGQTFAHLLMTSATLNHNMKHHLLRTMQMTNEELNSFEPIIAAAWDHWNHQRMHYIQSQAQAGNSEAENGEDIGGIADPSSFQQMASQGPPQGGSIDPSLAAQAVDNKSKE